MTLPPSPNSKNILSTENENSKDSSILKSPETTRVSIVSDNTQFDLSLPSQIPIALILNDVVKLIKERVPSNNSDQDSNLNSVWTLQKIGFEPFSPDKSLSDYKIKDGELLLVADKNLHNTSPIYDDVIEAISETMETKELNEKKISNWLSFSIANFAIIIASLIALLNSENSTNILVLGIVITIISLAMFFTFYLSKNTFSKEFVSQMLTISLGLAFLGPLFFVGDSSIAQKTLLGFTLNGILAIIGLRFSEKLISIFVSFSLVGFIVICTTVPFIVFNYSTKVYSISLILLGILILSFAANFSLVFSKIPLPPVPTIGEMVEDEFKTNNVQIAGTTAVMSNQIPELSLLQQKAKIASSFLAGFLTGSVFLIFVGSAYLLSNEINWKFCLFIFISGLVVLLRNRVYADILKKIILFTGGSLIILLSLYKFSTLNSSYLLTATIILLIFISLLVSILNIQNLNKFSPVARRMSEILEYLAIVSIFPLAIWITGIYSFIRDL